MKTNQTKNKKGKTIPIQKPKRFWQKPVVIFTSLFLTAFVAAFAFNINKPEAVANINSSQTEATSIVQGKRPMDYFQEPNLLQDVWDTIIPFAKETYTKEEVTAQKQIQEKAEDGIMSYSPSDKEQELTSIDVEDITPFTWKWIDLELTKEDGTLSKIHLRRPNWWFKELKADDTGSKVYLDMPEMGIVGNATVKNIRINQLDTRFWNENRKGDYVSRPITGKFEHESNDVYLLHFGNNPEPLGVTGSHPIWSVDKNDWTAASDLRIGEKVKTQDGITVLKSRTKSDRRQKVYNLEIYKDHNFLVSNDKILVHNSCEILKQAKKYGLNASSKTTKELLDNFGMKATEWIAKYRKGSIKSVLGDTGNKTIGEIFDAADSQTRKMIMDGRFKK